MSWKPNDVYNENLESSFKKSPDRNRKGEESFDPFLEAKEAEERSYELEAQQHELGGGESSF